MSRMASVALLLVCFASVSLVCAQSDSAPGPNDNPPSSANVSSSSDTKIDLSPPKDDAKDHPNSAQAVADLESEESPRVPGSYPWNPLKANKDLEVGDFYYSMKNYPAALDRYREALEYKPGDAMANFKLGECLEKMNQPTEAVAHYKEYLKILPHGPKSKDAEKALAKLEKEQPKAPAKDRAKR